MNDNTKQILFGTDGIRACANDPILNEKNMFKLGQILAYLSKDQKKQILVATDTRESADRISRSISLGINSLDVATTMLGIIPTPTLAFLTKKLSASFGVMVSASHNPSSDNGVKIFFSNGYKIDNDMQNNIENLFYNKSFNFDTINKNCKKNKILVEHYIDHIKNNFSFTNKSLKIVLDCANGAAYKIALSIFDKLGFNSVITINDKPNGININENCGSENTASLQQEVLKNNADIGIAFDGDADRAVFIDENGKKIDGEAIISLFAIEINKSNKLNKNTISTTIMSSSSLEKALNPYKIAIKKTDVGDKNVAYLMQNEGLSFGAENSGHFIISNLSTTGDGIISALYLISIMDKYNKKISEICSFFIPSEQVLFNISVTKKIPLSDLPNTQLLIKNAENSLSLKHGRILFRYSGTEMKARLLIESENKKECEKLAEEIIKEFNKEYQLALT